MRLTRWHCRLELSNRRLKCEVCVPYDYRTLCSHHAGCSWRVDPPEREGGGGCDKVTEATPNSQHAPGAVVAWSLGTLESEFRM